MTQTNRPLRLGTLLLALLGLGSIAPGIQAQDEPTWFQVETVIFARTADDDGIEQWPRNIQLRYPFNWAELQDPETAAGRSPAELQHQPFLSLPRGERKLNAHANAINRRDAYQVLFHKAWRQPVREQQHAPAILITGGEKFGNHYELEGSITLSLARYLHLHTRLWLTEFEPNFGQPPGAWPELPRRPNNLQPSEAKTEPWDDFEKNDSSTWDLGLNTPSSQPDFIGEDYLPSRIVTLNQQRRMRSRELHYIDHPLFGIIIEITPYELPTQDKTDEGN